MPDEDSQKPPYKTGYFVPNFGEDHDIANIKEATSAAEEKVDHKWNPKQDDDGARIVPQPIDAASYSYRP